MKIKQAIVSIILAALTAIVLLSATYQLGYYAGRDDTIAKAEFAIPEIEDWEEPNGELFDARMIIDLDGERWERGVWIG